LLFRFCLFAAIGIGAAVGLCFFDYTKFKRFALPIYGATLFVLILAILTGVKHIDWYISAFASVVFIIAFAAFTDKFRNGGMLGIVRLAGLALVSIVPLFLKPDMMTAAILFAAYAVILFAAVYKNHFGGNVTAQKMCLYGGLVLALFFAVIMVVSASYRLDRVLAFIRNTDPLGANFQTHVLREVLHNSQWFGNAGAVVYSPSGQPSLPGLQTNLALANVIATFGRAAGGALILAISALIARMFALARRVKNGYGYYLSLAACVILTAEFVTNVLMNLGVFPIVGTSLPFVSYGGTSYVVNMALVGIILSVWRRNNMVGAEGICVRTEKKPLFEYHDGQLTIHFK
jgi:cell division protein FtsW (lipid II flippase)